MIAIATGKHGRLLTRWIRSRATRYLGVVILFSGFSAARFAAVHGPNIVVFPGLPDLGYAVAGGAVIWFGILSLNRACHFFVRRKLDPVADNLLPALFNSALAGFATMALVLLHQYAHGEPVDPQVGEELSLIAALFAGVVGVVYRLPFIQVSRDQTHRHLTWLRQAELNAQMAALKAQLDPHFLANSITALCQLIESEPAGAAVFAEDLAWIYEYVLQKGQVDLVELDDELEFVERYFNLIQRRFGTRVQLHVAGRETAARNPRIPPLALQTLVENAIKHTPINRAESLRVDILVSADQATIRNPLRGQVAIRRSGGLGLTNLDRRLRLLSGHGLRVDVSDGHFAVTVPLFEPQE